jgi:hypothetical protein
MWVGERGLNYNVAEVKEVASVAEVFCMRDVMVSLPNHRPFGKLRVTSR